MDIIGRKTTMLDGSKVYDINIPCNSNPMYGHKVIITCESEKDAHAFVAGLEKLLEKHTVERFTDIDMEIEEE